MLPVFNGVEFLQQQITSILTQTHSDYELLIYDDGSRDGSPDLLRIIAATDPRVRLLGSRTNLGQQSALRHLLAKASGRYLMFSDQDDIWHPRKIEVLFATIGNASLSYGASHLVDQEGQEIGKTVFDFVGPPIDGSDRIEFLFRSIVSGHAMLVQREVVDAEVFVCGTHYDWLIAVLATFSAGVVYAPDAITYHRQHARNQLNNFGRSAEGRPEPRQSKRQHRIMRIYDALSVLRMATTVSEQKRVAFNHLYRVLRNEIILGVSSAIYNKKFELAFTEALNALNIPEVERRRVHKPIMKICRGPMHPKTIRDALF